MNNISIGSMKWLFLVMVYLFGARANLNDPELYVSDYYPQDSYHYPYRYQYPDDYLQSNNIDEPGYFLDYPIQPHSDDSNRFEKRVLTSFRERMEREKSKEQDKFADLFLQRLEQDFENKKLENEYNDNKNYIEMIEDLWGKFKNSPYDKDSPVFVDEMKKRQIPFPVDYSTLGWSGVGYKKRSFDVDSNNQIDYLYTKRKRFPVAKRSSNFYKKSKNSEKLLTGASGTDPKVVQDLSKIFGNKQNITNNTSLNNKLPSNKKLNSAKTTKSIDAKHNHEHINNENPLINNEPLNIKKKSIDWSNYFGIDRRKKKLSSFNNENDIDNDWLIKKYNNAVTTAVKRTSEYPLSIFRNHNVKKESEAPKIDKPMKKEAKSDEIKLRDMDDKLKSIEDLIIDEALKYTGSHDGETDPAEIQEIKDKVISRLAAAYSLEKMRRALSEFKSSLASQKYENDRNVQSSTYSNPPESKSQTESVSKAEEKEKKTFEMEKKCSQKSGKCENNDMVNKIQTTLGHCESIESRCHRVMKGGYNSLFYPLCKWHQLCYVCQGGEEGESDESEELGTCDLLFMQRADALCHGDVICTWAARPALLSIRQLNPIPPSCIRDQICAR